MRDLRLIRKIKITPDFTNNTLQQKKHFYWIDWLRFLSAMMVLLAHLRGSSFVEYGSLPDSQKNFAFATIYAFTRLGSEAVIVFFVLSGFLVGGKSIERIINKTFKPLNYAIDRLSRICIPLIPALLLTAIVKLSIGDKVNFIHLIGNLFSLQGILVPSFADNAPLWSLPYEVWCYVLMFIVGTVAIKKYFNALFVIFFVIILILLSQLNISYLLCWFVGLFAYVYRPQTVSFKILSIAILLSIFGIFSVQVNMDSISLDNDIFKFLLISIDISRLLLALGIALLIQQLILLKPNNKLVKIENLGTKLASFSYTLYLTHTPIRNGIESYFNLHRMENLDIASMSIFFLKIFICLCLAWILYWLFEKRTLKIRKTIMFLTKPQH